MAHEIRTERLLLRRPRPADAVEIFAILGDPRTVEHNPSDRVGDLQEAGELVSRWIAHWKEHGFGYWCVLAPGSDRILGYAGLKRATIASRPALNLVYRFAPKTWGCGYATEAAGAAVSQITAQMPAATIVARVRPDNRASQSVALKLGLHRDPTMDCLGEDGLDWAFTNRSVDATPSSRSRG
ncbi:MAG: GNAT family N-acetyltransferase [Nocardioides sp.]